MFKTPFQLFFFQCQLFCKGDFAVLSLFHTVTLSTPRLYPFFFRSFKEDSPRLGLFPQVLDLGTL